MVGYRSKKGSLRVSELMQRLLKTGSDARGHKSELRASETKSDEAVARLRCPSRFRRGSRRIAHVSWKTDLPPVYDGKARPCFHERKGKPLEPVLVHREYKKLLSAANLPSTLRFHDLRHSAASLLLAQGVHARAMQWSCSAIAPSRSP